MSKKRHTPEQIIRKLREAEVELAKGQKVPAVCRKLEITEQTYYRWRKEYGGLRLDQAKRLKELEQENARLKRLVADLTLDKQILEEVTKKTSEPDEASRSCGSRSRAPRGVRTPSVPGPGATPIDSAPPA
jgi:transposase-like protein